MQKWADKNVNILLKEKINESDFYNKLDFIDETKLMNINLINENGCKYIGCFKLDTESKKFQLGFEKNGFTYYVWVGIPSFAFGTDQEFKEWATTNVNLSLKEGTNISSEKFYKDLDFNDEVKLLDIKISNDNGSKFLGYYNLNTLKNEFELRFEKGGQIFTIYKKIPDDAFKSNVNK